MEIVIDIDDELYEQITVKKEYYLEDGESLCTAVANGIPLPKGHGRLIDEEQIPGDGGWKMIAIKDMEMPKCCSECELKSGSYCYHKKPPYDLNSIDVLKERASDCPLVEIITCKDCKHWHDDGIITTCDKSIGNGFPKDYYCADGEKLFG